MRGLSPAVCVTNQYVRTNIRKEGAIPDSRTSCPPEGKTERVTMAPTCLATGSKYGRNGTGGGEDFFDRAIPFIHMSKKV